MAVFKFNPNKKEEEKIEQVPVTLPKKVTKKKASSSPKSSTPKKSSVPTRDAIHDTDLRPAKVTKKPKK